MEPCSSMSRKHVFWAGDRTGGLLRSLCLDAGYECVPVVCFDFLWWASLAWILCLAKELSPETRDKLQRAKEHALVSSMKDLCLSCAYS